MKSQTFNQTDPDGRHVVGVPLTNAPDKLAWLYREDFERIIALYPGDWSLYDARLATSSVRTRHNSNSVSIARLVAEAPKGFSTRFYDEDRLNLRRTNLLHVRGDGGQKRRKFRPFLGLKIVGSARV